MGTPGSAWHPSPGGNWPDGDGNGIWWPPEKPRDLRTIKQGKKARASGKTAGVRGRGRGTQRSALPSTVKKRPHLVGGCPTPGSRF